MKEYKEEGSVDLVAVAERIGSDMVPKVGMEFRTKEDAYSFYLRYAYYVGFGV